MSCLRMRSQHGWLSLGAVFPVVFLLAAFLLCGARSLDAQPSELGSRDWLEVEADPGADLPASAIISKREPIYYGDVVNLEIVLANPSQELQVLEVEARLNGAAFFVEASHDATIVEPETAPLARQIRWPRLSLPGHSSGRLELIVVLRGSEDAGDVVVDIEAFDVMNLGEPVRLNFYRQLTYNPDIEYASAPLWLWVVIGGFVLSLLAWIVTRSKLAPEHPIRLFASRSAAFWTAAFLGLIAYGLVQGTIDSYRGVTETRCQVLDRRVDLETMTQTSHGDSGTTYERPLIAARFQTPRGEMISVGFGSDVVSPDVEALADFQIGDEVRCWHDDDWMESFFVVRGVEFSTVLIFALFAAGALILLYLAFRPSKS